MSTVHSELGCRMMPDEPCVPSPTPFKAHTCDRCGRVLPHAHPVRSTAYEQAFLEAAETQAPLVGPGWTTRCRQRLAMGQEMYGSKFMRLDNLLETMEETPDIATYTVLELEKHIALGLDPLVVEVARLDLVKAAALACEADWYVQRARETLAGL